MAGQTTWPTCAGSKSNTNQLYPSRYTRCKRGHSSIRPGTKPPTHGARDAHHHSPTPVTISAREEDFRAHGHTLARETHHLTTTAMADTGCLAGPSLMSSLHLSENELIPVSLVMHSASGTNLPILGATLLRIRIQLTGIKTRQMVYFSSMATKLYLSLATCADLGLIPKEFPISTDRVSTPRQAPPPPPPPCLPFPAHAPREPLPLRGPPPPPPTPATAANRELLERHLLDLYSASAFNVCEHQPLPMMTAPLSIDPTAVPKPCHTPTKHSHPLAG